MKEKILNTAVLIIKESGIAALSMRNIAKELNISATALYRHFKNKEAILLQLSEKGYKELLSKLTTALSMQNSKSRLQYTLFEYYNFCGKNKSIFFIMNGVYFYEFSNLLLLLSKQKLSTEKFLLDRIEEYLISIGKRKAKAELIKDSFIFLLNGFFIQQKFDDLTKTKEEIDQKFRKILMQQINILET